MAGWRQAPGPRTQLQESGRGLSVPPAPPGGRLGDPEAEDRQPHLAGAGAEAADPGSPRRRREDSVLIKPLTTLLWGREIGQHQESNCEAFEGM